MATNLLIYQDILPESFLYVEYVIIIQDITTEDNGSIPALYGQ